MKAIFFTFLLFLLSGSCNLPLFAEEEVVSQDELFEQPARKAPSKSKTPKKKKGKGKIVKPVNDDVVLTLDRAREEEEQQDE